MKTTKIDIDNFLSLVEDKINEITGELTEKEKVELRNILRDFSLANFI